MRRFTKEELDIILERHRKWLNVKDGGERADLSHCDLRWFDLRDYNLRCANLKYAYLKYSNLSGADLREADLSNANLEYCNFYNAKLLEAKLDNVKCNHGTLFFNLQCPEEGPFFGYKKVIFSDNAYIIKLLIPENAKRSSATTRKCRCEFAKVLEIQDLEGNKLDVEKVINYNYRYTIYKVGKYVYPDSFDENRWNECSNGIHFFITRNEAVEYYG